MAYEVEPTSERWRDIINTQDEVSQARKIRTYIYELENKVNSQENEIRRLKEENKKFKKQILSLDVVKEAISKAKSDAYHDCNTDWSGFQGGA